jgi:hypothetical protein
MRTDLKALAQNADNEAVELSLKMALNLAKCKELQLKLRNKHLTEAQVCAFGTELDRTFDRWHQMREQLAAIETLHRAYGWNRAYIVPGGHVHRDVNCHTLYADTVRYIVPECSALTEAEIVEMAADRACTVCYPSAPVDKKSTLKAPGEDEVEQRKTERLTKAQEKEAKKIRVLLPHGEYANGPAKEVTYGSVVSARTEAADDLWWALFAMDADVERKGEPDAEYAARRLANFHALTAAITAHRDGKVSHVDELEAELVKKVGQKYVKGLTTRSTGWEPISRPEALKRYQAAKDALDALQS